jgi:hypothetical protein
VFAKMRRLHPRGAASRGIVADVKVLTRVLVAIAEAWDANWGVVESWDYQGRKEDADGQLLRPWGGWITYLAAHDAGRVSLPSAARVEPAAGGGLVIVATQEPFTVANPAHTAALDAIQEALAPIRKRAGGCRHSADDSGAGSG